MYLINKLLQLELATTSWYLYILFAKETGQHNDLG